MKYTDGWKYRIEEDEVFQTGIYPQEDIVNEYVSLTKNGKLTLHRGFCFDGPSGEVSILKVFTIDVTRDTKKSMCGSGLHDGLAYLMRQGLLPPIWYRQMNKEFRMLLIRDGMWNWKAQVWYKVVDTVDDYIDPKNKKKVHIAP